MFETGKVSGDEIYMKGRKWRQGEEEDESAEGEQDPYDRFDLDLLFVLRCRTIKIQQRLVPKLEP
jgi:hypothetical protein